MIAEKYQFVQQNNTLKMGELVARLLYEIKLTVVNMQIENQEEELKKAQANNDLDRQFDILRHQPELLNLRNEICKRLGNRVINI